MYLSVYNKVPTNNYLSVYEHVRPGKAGASELKPCLYGRRFEITK